MFKGTPKRYSKHVTPDLRRTVASMGAIKKTAGLNQVDALVSGKECDVTV